MPLNACSRVSGITISFVQSQSKSFMKQCVVEVKNMGSHPDRLLTLSVFESAHP